MASAVLGKVSPTPKGEYVSTQDYDRLDVVTYEGYPYLAKSNVPSGNLPTDELYWMPLLTGLDFAPGGYGLGMTAKEILDANTAVDNGWYKLTSVNVANAHIPFQYVAIYVTAYSDKYVTQDLYRTNGQNAHMRRELYNGTWGEWEYVNPPLLDNVEYRTTERVDGKAVYKKRDSNGKIMYRLDGSSTWTEGLPGAAPATIVQKEIKAASEAELDNALTAELNTMPNNSVGFLVISPLSTALFDGIGMLCELYKRSSSGYATATFTGYGTTSPAIYYKTMWAGAWKPMVDGAPSAFAPSGYGLGLSDSTPLCSNANDAWQNGWFKIDSSTQNGIGVSAIMRVDARASAYSVCQTAYSTSWSSAYPVVRQRWCMNGTWDTEWSWVDPPMALGIEYRTTERWGGNVVYAKCVSGGSWLDQKTINIPVDNCYRVTRFEAVAGDYCLPFIYNKNLNGNYTAYVRVSRTSTSNIEVKMCGGLDGNAGTYATVVTVFYAKNE